MHFIYEFKNRIILICFMQFALFCVCYNYKEPLCFLFANKLLIVNKNFYFLSTNLIELFNTYLSIINFFNLQFLIIYACYYFFVFLLPGLYFKEIVFLTKFLLILIFILNLTLLITFCITIPCVFSLFANFNKASLLTNNFFHFEIKITDYLHLIKRLYYAALFCLINTAILILIKTNFFFCLASLTKWKKIYYFNFLIFSTAIAFEITTNALLLFFFLFMFELFLLIMLITKKIRKKQDLNLRLLK